MGKPRKTPTIGEMVEWLEYAFNDNSPLDEDTAMQMAIQEALIERDKLFEEVHELKLELVGFKRKKPKVSRGQVAFWQDELREAVKQERKDAYSHLNVVSMRLHQILRELGIEVED